MADISGRRGGVQRSRTAAVDAGPQRVATGTAADAATDLESAVQAENSWSTTEHPADNPAVSAAGADAASDAFSVRGDPGGSVRLVVGVLTGGRNRARRDAVRQTWGADPR